MAFSHMFLQDTMAVWVRKILLDIPSGKRLRNYGKSPFLMGKSTINGNVQ